VTTLPRSAAQQDTEITLGTGRMLALFFAFVLVCAVFFAIGFSLGRKTASLGTRMVMSAPAGSPTAVVRPSAAKTNPAPAATQSNAADHDATKSSAATPAATGSDQNAAASNSGANGTAGGTGGYLVQVAAVSRQEDADALVDALKKKQYPAFASNSSPGDKLYRVQVGPYSDLKEAEAMRARLISDGYNPIVKK
jgi:DedD protein